LVVTHLALLVEVKHLFSTTPVTEIFSKPSWIETEVNGGHWGDRTRSRYDQTRPVSGRVARGGCGQFDRHVRSITGPARPIRHPEGQQIARSIGRGARLVMIGRTHSVASGCLLETTGRWHCGVQFVKRTRPVEVSRARVVCELRVRSMSLARPVVFDYWSVESTVEIGWPRLNPRGHVDGTGRPNTVQRVRSVRPARSVVPKIVQ
jgi:hypothetical protein